MRASRWLLVTALGAGAGLAPLAAAAQQPAPAGTWTVEFVRAIRDDVEEKGHARMVLELRGDSAQAQWQALQPGPGGQVPPTLELRGTVAGNHVVLTGRQQARIMRNGDESTVGVTVTFDFTVDGDKLTGTRSATSDDGLLAGDARPISGVREKAGS